MADNHVDTIEFRAVSPKTKLTGLDDAHRKLVAMNVALEAINRQLAGLSTHSSFTRTTAGIADTIKQLERTTGKGAPLKQVAQVLGFDPKDVRQYYLREQEKLTQGLRESELKRAKLRGPANATARLAMLTEEKKLQAELNSLRRTFEGQQMRVSGAGSAAKFFHDYQKAAVRQAKDPVNAIRALFGAPGAAGPAAASGPASVGPASVSGSIPLIIPASQIVATLGPGAVQVMMPAGSVATPGGGMGGVGAGGGGGAGRSGAMTPSEEKGKKLQTRTTTTARGRRVETRELMAAGQTLDRFYKEVHGELQATKEVSTVSALQKAKSKFESQIAGVKEELARGSGPGVYRKQADMLRGMMGTTDEPSAAAKELEQLGQGALVTRARTQASKWDKRAATLEEQANREKEAEQVEQFRQRARLRKELDAARRRGDKAEEKRLRDEAATIEQQKRVYDDALKSRNKVDAARAKVVDKMRERTEKRRREILAEDQAKAFRSATYAGTHAAVGDFIRAGGQEVSRQAPYGGAPGKVVYEREQGGQKHTLTATYGAKGAEAVVTTKKLSQARNEFGYLGDMVTNTSKVAAWAASVAVLYKSLELVKHSLMTLVTIGPQVGRLEQVFKGVGGTVHELTADVIGLAAANGADTHQAMEAAIQWSRLGLTRVQVNEAVRVSLMAANVAQMDALDATEALQGVMQAYGLRVGELRGELSQIVQLSNTYNVTNADMLTGLTKVASVARQAGLPLAELQGLMAATIGGTAQSGANIGNMMKSVILGLSNPDLQSKLRKEYRFEATSGGEEIKPMNNMLADLFVKYQHLNDLQRQSMLFSIAGRTQSSRLAEMLNSYVKAQVLAVNAQLNLNTAEAENAKIKAALGTQLKGLSAEWERFVVITGNKGPVQVMTALTTALRNVIGLMNTPVGNTAITGILGLVTAAGMKTMMAGMSLQSGGFLSKTGQRLRGAMGGLNTAAMQVFANAMGGGIGSDPKTKVVGIYNPTRATLFAEPLYKYSEALLRVGRSSAVSSGMVRGMATALGATTRAIGVGLIALRSWLVPLLAIYVGVKIFNDSMERMGITSERAEAKLAGFNEEAERAAAAAAAYAEAAKAFETIERAISPEKGFPDIRPADAAKYIQQSAGLAGLYETDPKKQWQAQEQYKAEAEALRKQGDLQGVLNLMERERLKLVAARREELQKEFVAVRAQQRAVADELDRLNAKQHGKFGWIGADTRAKKMAELERQQADLGGRKTRNIVEQSDEWEKQARYSTQFQTNLKTQELLWQSIAEIYQTVNTNNPLERAGFQIQALEAQNEAIQKHLDLLDEEDKADTQAQSAKQDYLKSLDMQESAARGQYADAKNDYDGNLREAGYVGPVDLAKIVATGTTPAMAAAQAAKRKMEAAEAELERIAQERSDAQQNQFPGPEGMGPQRRAVERSEDLEQRKKNEAERVAMERNFKQYELSAYQQFGQRDAHMIVRPYAYGRDETQSLLHQRFGIEKEEGKARGDIARLSSIGERTDEQKYQLMEARNRLLELEGMQIQNNLALRARSYEVEREINQLMVDRRKEFEHSILGAGPGEMLRKLAANRMGQGGDMGIGQFLSLSPDMRRDVSMIDTRFDPHMMDLRREQQRVTRDTRENFNRTETDLSRRRMMDSRGMTSDMAPNFAAGTEALNHLTTAAERAAQALDRLADRQGAAPAPPSGKTLRTPEYAPTGNAPRNPQSGGVGGGEGHGDDSSRRSRRFTTPGAADERTLATLNGLTFERQQEMDKMNAAGVASDVIDAWVNNQH